MFWVLTQEENEYILIYPILMTKTTAILLGCFNYGSRVNLAKCLHMIIVLFIYEVTE